MSNKVSLKTDFLEENKMHLSFQEIRFQKYKNLKDYRNHGLPNTYFILYRMTQN